MPPSTPTKEETAMAKKGRFLIKETFVNGNTCLLRKGGWVVGDGEHLTYCDYYTTRGIAQRVCNQMQEANNRDVIRYNGIVSPRKYEVYEA